jgi:hypothetical protein
MTRTFTVVVADRKGASVTVRVPGFAPGKGVESRARDEAIRRGIEPFVVTIIGRR